MPCRSGLPSVVRGGVQAFASVDVFVAGDWVCPEAGFFATRAMKITAASAIVASERWLMESPLFSVAFGKKTIQQFLGKLHVVDITTAPTPSTTRRQPTTKSRY